MKNRLHIMAMFLAVLAAMTAVSCSDDDSFSASPSNVLSFETDTLSLDTVFATVPSPHKQFKVYNNSGDGIRIVNARLEKGNQMGFRVNVNGSELSPLYGYQATDLELRKGDSLRVFVELTSVATEDTLPRFLDDNIIFSLESGVSQKVNLNAYSWNALFMRNVMIDKDTVLSNLGGRPIVVYDTIRVNPGATLNIAPGTTMYFHDGAGISVGGRLVAKGTKDEEILMRCDRLDRMVSNLTYDNNPGQWGGISIDSTSFENELDYVEIHGATSAIVCDSSVDATRRKLTLTHSTLHNLKGFGIHAMQADIKIENTQISNAFAGCLTVYGGNIDINNSTIVQYYPFDARRGSAISYYSMLGDKPYPLTMSVRNSIVKGYADDVLVWSYDTLENNRNVTFDNSLLRTIKPDDKDSLMFVNSMIEDVTDTLTNGRNSFVLFDTDNFFYDFTPVEGSPAIGTANPQTALPDDRRGRARSKEAPSMGCFEVEKKEEEVKND